MGRPPNSGGPVFRFTQSEVAQMEGCLQNSTYAVPARELISYLAEKFSASAERAGKSIVQSKQVWNWFQNRRYAQRTKIIKTPTKLNLPSTPQEDSITYRNVANSSSIAPVSNTSSNTQLEFEAKSSRDGAWYDVSSFLSHRMFETGDPEVRVRFAGFGIEEDEWINIRKCVRPRSLPCEPSECVAVLSGDLILCFQEGKDQALYFDAHVLDAQRRRHDIRGCRCRFLVRYDHDQSEEIVPLRKICRRPETDYRLQLLHASKGFGPVDTNITAQKLKKQHKLMDVSIEEVALPIPQSEALITVESTATATDGDNALLPTLPMSDVAITSCSAETSTK